MYLIKRGIDELETVGVKDQAGDVDEDHGQDGFEELEMVGRVEEAPEHFVGQGDESEEVGEPEEEDGDDELAEQEEDWDRDRVEDPLPISTNSSCQ